MIEDKKIIKILIIVRGNNDSNSNSALIEQYTYTGWGGQKRKLVKVN